MLKSMLSILLSLLLAATPLLAAPTDNQTAGEVKALIPDASRNAQPVKIKDGLAWNDLLKTEAQGRLRAGLTDGSILSVGSNSELRVVQHDAASQQTSIEVNYGKLRNQVVKISKPGGKYEVKTPNAVMGVIGTDFYVGYANNQTTVICYVGKVAVTPAPGTKVLRRDNESNSTTNTITLLAGQMVVIGLEIPPGGYQATATPPALAEASMLDTNVPDQPVSVAKSHRRLRKVLIGIGVAAGLGLGLGFAESSGSSKSSPPPPPPTTTTIDFTNHFGTVNVTSAGIVSKGSELQNYNGIAAPPRGSLGGVSFSAGAFTGANILTGGTFASAGSSFVVTSGGPANNGLPPRGNIFTGSFVGPVAWTLVSQTTKYTDNFTLSGAFSGTLYTGAAVTGTTTQNITLYTNQWVQDHETLIGIGKGQFSIPAVGALRLAGARFESPDARLNALARKSMRRKGFGWTFVF